MVEATKRPKYRLPISFFAMDGRSFALFEFFRATMKKQMPRIRQIFTMFEPKTFPMATPMVSCPIAEKMATESSGKDVEKATRMNPTVVFPKPVMSATLTEFVIVQSLALSKTSNAARRISALINRPSNKASLHPFARANAH